MSTNQHEDAPTAADIEATLKKFCNEHGKFNVHVTTVVQSLDAMKAAYGGTTSEEAEKMMVGAKVIYKTQN